MKRADAIAGGLLAAGFGAALWEATSFQYRTEFAPGPGFAPVWISAIGIVIALLVAVDALRSRRLAEDAADTSIDKGGLARVAVTLAGLLAMIVVVPWFGFVPAIFAFLLFLTLGVQRLSWVAGVSTAAGTVAFVYLVFVHFLGVPIPSGPLGF